MIRINLIPVPKARKQEKLIIETAVAAVVLGVTISVCYFIGYQMSSSIDELKTENTSIQRNINELKAKVGEVEKFKQKAKTLKQQLDVITSLEKGRTGPVRVLDELTDLVPKKLWITSFDEKGGAVKIEGFATDGTIVADFLENIKKANFFKNAVLERVTSASGGDDNQKFTINLKVSYDG